LSGGFLGDGNFLSGEIGQMIHCGQALAIAQGCVCFVQRVTGILQFKGCQFCNLGIAAGIVVIAMRCSKLCVMWRRGRATGEYGNSDQRHGEKFIFLHDELH